MNTLRCSYSVDHLAASEVVVMAHLGCTTSGLIFEVIEYFFHNDNMSIIAT